MKKEGQRGCTATTVSLDNAAGRLIVLEGPDGVGKTTIAKRVSSTLNELGSRSKYMAFPGNEEGTLGRLVYDVHHHPEGFGLECFSETSRQALHVVAHVDAIEREIRPTLEDGTNIVLDRFWWSTWVYGIVAGIERKTLAAMIDFENRVWGTWKPWIVILLQRDHPIDRDVDQSYWLTLFEEYNRLSKVASRDYPVVAMKNVGTLDETVERIMEIISRDSVVGNSLDPCGDNTNGLEQQVMCFGDDYEGGDSPPELVSHIAPAVPTEVFDTFWRFAAERQNIFFRRLRGEPRPWTTDPILSKFKFTNAYRASDRVSQYLIRNVIYREDLPSTVDEVFFRIILFKLFNKIETWEILQERIGPITYQGFSFDRYDRVLSQQLSSGESIYSAAYIIPGPTSFGHQRKHRNHLKLIELIMTDELPKRIADAPGMYRAFELVRGYPSIGDFLAYQFVTDVNYSEITGFSEMEFVIPGPGALDGVGKCFSDLGGLTPSEIIKFVTDTQEEEFVRLGLHFHTLWGRRLQLIDCQNLFCEVSKYARVKHPNVPGVSGRTRIKQKYKPHRDPMEVWYPPKWGINEHISRDLSANTKGSTERS